MEVTETLVGTLATPTANKQRKLQETKEANQAAMEDAFNEGCETQSETNDIVVKYNLSGYTKNAIKKLVPQLTDKDTYDADELDDDLPVKFTNDGFDLDHKPQNEYEWYIKIPHHDDYHLWFPLKINPEQREWYEALYNEDARNGEFRLIEQPDGHWHVHTVVHREIEQQSISETDVTPVGVDIGEASLATVCHRDHSDSPATPELYIDESKEVRRLREQYFSVKRRLQRRDSERLYEEYGDKLWRRIDDIIHNVSYRVVEYADDIENAVLVLEDLSFIRESMDYGDFMNRRLHGWAFAKLQSQIQYKAAERGIPVETVEPAYTSKTCHACKERGRRSVQAEFACTNESCWVSEYHGDINAAINIADRYLAGESQPRTSSDSEQKVVDDDSGEDGACLTGPQDSHADVVSSTRPSAGAEQTTLGTYTS